MVADFENICNK